MGDYTLRDIPSDLHRAWKSAAALKGWTMKDYCYVAIQRQVVIDVGQKENVNVESKST